MKHLNTYNVFLYFEMSVSNSGINRTFLARVISGGRVTIPEELRELLGIREGDMIELQILKLIKKEVING